MNKASTEPCTIKRGFLADLYSTFGKVVIYSLSYDCNAATRVIKSHPDMKGEKTDRWKKMSSKCSTFMLIVVGIFYWVVWGLCVLGGGGCYYSHYKNRFHCHHSGDKM